MTTELRHRQFKQLSQSHMAKKNEIQHLNQGIPVPEIGTIMLFSHLKTPFLIFNESRLLHSRYRVRYYIWHYLTFRNSLISGCKIMPSIMPDPMPRMQQSAFIKSWFFFSFPMTKMEILIEGCCQGRGKGFHMG